TSSAEGLLGRISTAKVDHFVQRIEELLAQGQVPIPGLIACLKTFADKLTADQSDILAKKLVDRATQEKLTADQSDILAKNLVDLATQQTSVSTFESLA